MKQLSTLILAIAGSLAISAIAVAYARPDVSAPARSAVTISQTNAAAALGPGTSSVARGARQHAASNADGLVIAAATTDQAPILIIEEEEALQMHP